MKQDNINYFSVGLFVFATIVVLLFGLYNITGSSTDTDDYFVELRNVTGIRTGSPVTYAGFEVGKLADIEPVRDKGATIFRLRLAIRSGWNIPKNSTAQIVTPGLLSEKRIEITEGDGKEYLAVGSTLAGLESADMFEIAKTISTEFQKLSEQGLKPLLNTLNKEIVDTIPGLTAQTRVMLENLNKSATEMLDILQTVDKKKLGRVLNNADEVSQDLLVISKTLDGSARKLDDMINSTAGYMAENNEDLRKALLDLRTTMGVVENNVNSIIYNLDTTSRNINEFSRQIRDNPGVLLNSKPPSDAAK